MEEFNHCKACLKPLTYGLEYQPNLIAKMCNFSTKRIATQLTMHQLSYDGAYPRPQKFFVVLKGKMSCLKENLLQEGEDGGRRRDEV